MVSVLFPCFMECLSPQAGIFEPAPDDEDALATPGGLLLNCINSGVLSFHFKTPRASPFAARDSFAANARMRV